MRLQVEKKDIRKFIDFQDLIFAPDSIINLILGHPVYIKIVQINLHKF